jgi:tRNA dimethylallyltransferase
LIRLSGAADGRLPVCVLFGPTASGKTAAAVRLAAEGVPLEVVSADSMQVYRGMDRGTAKPGPEERNAVPHHLLDIRNPDEQFTAGDFVRLADAACADIVRRGKLPLVSGGTGFYLKNFLSGLPEAPPSDPEVRAGLKAELARRGAAALWEELRSGDPVSAGRIHINDEYRLLRALEVLRFSGRPLSSYAASGAGAARGSSGGGRPQYRFLVIGLRRCREELYRRINERCAAMFRGGLPAEVEGLWKMGYSPRDPGLRAIGYREFFIEDSPGIWRFSGDSALVEARVAQDSRRYAKRQITYFSALAGTWLSAEDFPGLRAALRDFLEGAAGETSP